MIRSSSRLASLAFIGLAALALSGSANAALAQQPVAPTRAALPLAAVGSLSDFFRGSPGTMGSSPSAFGPAMGDVFIGGAYINEVRRTYVAADTWAAGRLLDDGMISLGFGLGDAVDGIGLSTVVTNFSPYRLGLGAHTTISAQLFRHLDPTLAIGVGGENALTAGGDKDNGSYYATISKIFWNPIKDAGWLQSITLTGGVGNGRFRTVDQVLKNEESVGGFAAAAFLFHDQVNFLADFTGQDLNLGLTLVPFRRFPIAFTPMVTEVLGQANSSARFVLGAGIGYHF